MGIVRSDRPMKNAAILLIALIVAPTSVFAAPASHEAKPVSLLALAGYEPLKGEGLVLTLSDHVVAHPKPTSVAIPGLVHDYDLLSVVNELRAAGAQGISLNGVRLTAQSAIRCVGPTIQVGRQTIGVPVKIEAVGKADLLRSCLQMPHGLLEQMNTSGPKVQLKVAPMLRLKAAPLPAPFERTIAK